MSMPQQVKKSLAISIYFALAVSALLVFWQVRNFDFVNCDDTVYVYENPHVLNGLTAANVIWAFTTGFASFWHPLTWLSLMLDCQLFGANAGRIHLVNLLFHIANTLLLFMVLKKMTGSLWPSAFVAALFALHPLHVESVAWIAARKDVLSTFFWLLAMLAYVRYVKQPGAARYLLVLLIFALGLMAKPMLVTLPFVFFLLDYWPLQRKISWRLLVEKIPFIVLSIASSVIAFLTQQSSGSIFAALPLKFRICNALISYMKYIEKMIWPSRLAMYYPHPVENVSVLYAVISAIPLLAVTILVIRFAKNHRYLATGWFWYLGTLIPVIGVIQVGIHAMADRYTYITLTGLFIIIAWGLPELLKKLLSASPVESPQRKIALGLSMVIVLTTLGICAHRQTSYWKNSFTLFSHTIEVTQNNWLAHNNLGNAYVRLGRYEEAIEAYKQAIKINPNLTETHTNLGVVYNKLGRYQYAIDTFKQAIKIKPDYAEAHYNLGIAYGSLSRWSEAIETFKQAIKIKPDYAEAYYNLGVAYTGLDRWPEAIDAYLQTIKIDPNYAKAYNNLGAVYINLSRWSEAIETFKQAIKIKPDYEGAYLNLGVAYLAIGDKNSALAEYNILKSLNSELANDLLKEINK
jgi:tetratricopeptide (TPR) repeat protein